MMRHLRTDKATRTYLQMPLPLGLSRIGTIEPRVSYVKGQSDCLEIIIFDNSLAS